MPVFKNEDNGTWYVMARYVNWKGERKQKCKRGFATKKEAQEWERMFQLQNSSDLDMSFEAFTELYINDVKNRLKENTWLTKEHIIRTKILPYLADIDVQAKEMFSRLVKEYADRQGVTEQLKAENQLLWIQKMSNIQSCVQEVVESEIIYS
jgi:dsDNA-binding SOS-regulon protein